MSSHDELEPKLTALLLGELPPAEAQALRAAIDQDPELEKLYQRLEQTLGLVREASTEFHSDAAPLRLSPKRREKVLAHFKTVQPKEFAEPQRKRFPLLEIAAALALIAILASALLPALSKAKTKSQRVYLAAQRQSSAASSANREEEAFRQRYETVSGEVVQAGGRATYHGKGGAQHPTETPIVLPQTDGVASSVSVGQQIKTPEIAGSLPVLVPAPLPSDSAVKSLTLSASASDPNTQLGFSVAPPAAPNTLNGALVSWADTAHSKQDNVGLADGSMQKFSRSKLQEALRNSGDLSAPDALSERREINGKVDDAVTALGQPLVDPSTGMPIPLKPDPGVTAVPLEESPNTPVPKQRSGKVTIGGTIILPQDTAVKPGSQLDVHTIITPLSAQVAGGVGDGGLNSNLSLERRGDDSKPAFYNDSYSQTHTFSTELNNELGANRYDQTYTYSFSGQPNSSPTAGKDGTQPPLLGDLPTLGKSFSPSNTLALGQRDELGRSLKENAILPQQENLGFATISPTNRFVTRYAYTATNSTDPDWIGILDRPGYRANNDSTPGAYDPSANITSKATGPSNVYNSHVVGYYNDSSPTTNLAVKAVEKSPSVTEYAYVQNRDEAKKRQSSIFLPGAATAGRAEGATTPPGVKAKSDPSSSEVREAQKEVQETPYFAKKAELEELRGSRQIIDATIDGEAIDEKLPKSTVVTIMDSAQAEQSQNPTFGERVRGFFSGEVERKARIKVERDQTDVSSLSERMNAQSFDPYFLQTEFETIRSEKVLNKVVEDLNLSEKWARNKGEKLSNEDAVRLLRKKLHLNPVQNTSFIEVGAKDDSAEQAAQLANAVASAYKDFHRAQRQELSQRGIKTLEERVAASEQKIAQAQTELDQLEKPAEKPPTDDVAKKQPTPLLIPQPEVVTRENAFSTFSLNVSDVSFKLATASLEKGVLPEAGSIRSEEFINAFDYRDPEPPAGVPVAFAWERARYPFAQNRDLLRFSLKTAATGRQAGRPLNLVLLLDNSGSMERADRVRIIQESLRVLVTQLQPEDKLSVITFSRTARLWKDGIPGNQAAQVAEEVSGLTPQGGTNLEEAMTLAYRTALRHYLTNGLNRVVVLTDGAANLGNVDPETLKQKVEANRKQGIALDCFGIGWDGYNDDLLEVLSRNGDGRYGFINTPEEATTHFATQLAGALQVAASDVKVQVEFNPNRVSAYRQIGYAKHQLTKEQFRDNTVDAAEIAAAESGNALYVIETIPSGEGPLATVRVRYKLPGTTDYREHEWTVPYAGTSVALEQSTPAMRLAATAAAFSEWLASSPYAAEVTPDRLLNLLRGIPEVYATDPRPKQLEWMLHQSQTLSAK